MKIESPFFSPYISSFLKMPSIRIASINVSARQKDEESTQSIEIGRKFKLESRFPLTQWEVVAVLSIFMLFSVALISIYLTMPNLDREILKFPRTWAELRDLKNHISAYSKDYTAQVLLGYIATYIFMQTFMIPGTIFFSLLAGALFGVYKGVILVVFSATAGASSCYFLSKLFGRPIAFWLWPGKLRFFRAEVAKRREKLLNYMLFLRVTPTLPNTFINLASPIVDVPYHTFVLATFFGIIPASIVTVRAGLTLGELQSLGDLYDIKTMLLFFCYWTSLYNTNYHQQQAKANARGIAAMSSLLVVIYSALCYQSER